MVGFLFKPSWYTFSYNSTTNWDEIAVCWLFVDDYVINSYFYYVNAIKQKP